MSCYKIRVKLSQKNVFYLGISLGGQLCVETYITERVYYDGLCFRFDIVGHLLERLCEELVDVEMLLVVYVRGCFH